MSELVTGRKLEACLVCAIETKDRWLTNNIEVVCCWECINDQSKRKIIKDFHTRKIFILGEDVRITFPRHKKEAAKSLILPRFTLVKWEKARLFRVVSRKQFGTKCHLESIDLIALGK